MGSELGLTPDSTPGISLAPWNIWWAVWAFVWTVVVAIGIWFLFTRRNMPMLRIRCLGLSFSAIFLLHMYWMSVQTGGIYAPLMPGDAQYWIMGTYLPCGIALFHASNSHFLHVAKMQRKYAEYEKLLLDAPPKAKRGGRLFTRFCRINYTTRVLILVGVAMIVQIFLTCLMWLISRKWHSSWGIPGTDVHGTEMEQKVEQGRGWEWWPGVFWQFLWSWIVAPIILYKSHNIHDTQGWRVQTIGCAIAGLPATPMWLIALYVPGMEKLNQYWIPPQWICLSIVFLEIFTVLLPCWEVLRHQSLRQETLDAIAQWERRTKGTNSDIKSFNSTVTMVESMMSGWKSTSDSVQTTSSRESILNMSALEYVLERNPTPLQKFSALNDFSGENVAFLTSVTGWKSTIPKALQESDGTATASDKELIRECFNRALFIYAEFISLRHAEFPVNISSQDLKKLESIFETPARILYGDEPATDPATPFENFAFDLPSPTSATYSESSEKPIQSSVALITHRAQYMGDIPGGFSTSVFDDAEQSIKYLVLTNTWPKFIRQRRPSIDSSDTLRSGMEVV